MCTRVSKLAFQAFLNLVSQVRPDAKVVANDLLAVIEPLNCVLLPEHVAGRNSLFFYSLSALAKPLSTLWLVREMFKQNHNTIDARIGRAVPFEVYAAGGFAASRLGKLFRKHVYRLATGGKPVFQSVETVAPPKHRLILRRELEASEVLGHTRDGKVIYLCRMDAAPCAMREIGRLRERTLRSVGEGCGQPRDIDRFDLGPGSRAG